MRSALILALVVAGGLALPDAGRAGPAPAWTAYADCAGAYQANAHVADADRPAAMVSQISDVADDYAKAARARYRAQLKAGEAAARKAVAARIAVTAGRLAAQPRDAAEKLIDACPQTDGG